MSLLSDVSIKKLLGKEIVIEPFNEEGLTPVGYDFSIGNFVYSLEKGMLSPNDGVYKIPPKNTIQILTNESLWVSGKIGGTFHSKVSLVSRGFSHISTTLDPGWFGPLLITLRNNTDRILDLKENDKFVTLIFFSISKQTKTHHNKPAYRTDILAKQLLNQTEEYIKKFSLILGDDQNNILNSFKEKVEQANKPMFSRVAVSINRKTLHNIARKIFIILIYVAIIAVSGLSLYWNSVNQFFYNITYDSKIWGAQVAAIISLVVLRVNLSKK